MRAALLILGWLVASVAIVGAFFVLGVDWHFWGWSGPRPGHTGLLEMWICAGAIGGLLWISQLTRDRVSQVASFLMVLPVAALGVMGASDAIKDRTPLWYALLCVATSFSPAMAWFLGLLLRRWRDRTDPSSDSLATDVLPSRGARQESPPTKGALRRHAVASTLVIVLVVLAVGHWRWETRWCTTTPAALFDAVGHGDLAAARWALQCGADPEASMQWGWTQPSRSGPSPLTMAAARGDTDMVRLLLDSGASVNRLDGDGAPAIFYAASCGNVETVQALLEANADPRLQNRRPIAIRTLSHLSAGSALHEAAGAGHVDIVELLLQHGGDVDMADCDGHTPLMMAAVNGERQTVETLLRLGAHKGKRNEKGKRAADLVADYIRQREEHALWWETQEGRRRDAEYRKNLEPYEQIRGLLDELPKPSQNQAEEGPSRSGHPLSLRTPFDQRNPVISAYRTVP